MSTTRRRPEDEIWFVHAPLKNEQRPIVHAPPPSNVPYLNGVMDTDEDLNKRPTMWFRETDSDFVRLSKLGGRQDLLVHKFKEQPKEPQGYPRPAWWVDMLTDVNEGEEKPKEPYVFQVPAWFAHKDKINEEEARNINPNYPYETSQRGHQVPRVREEKIEEPRKYGQLRNYLHPVNVKSNNAAYERTRPM